MLFLGYVYIHIFEFCSKVWCSLPMNFGAKFQRYQSENEDGTYICAIKQKKGKKIGNDDSCLRFQYCAKE